MNAVDAERARGISIGGDVVDINCRMRIDCIARQHDLINARVGLDDPDLTRNQNAAKPSQKLEALGKATGTDPSEWGYANKDGVELHQTAKADSPVVEKLGLYLVRVLADTGQGADPNDPLFLHIAAPDGKTGYADAQLVSPLGSDQMCYAKEASGWKIAGYLGGASQ